MSIEAMNRIKSLLQDTKMIDSHTISAVVAECDMVILAQQPATPEPLTLKGAMTGMVDAQIRDLWPTKKESATPEPVEDGIRNAEDELSCAEEVLDAITCEFSDGEFPVTDFNCIGDYITAVVDVFKERLAARQPDTPEPVVDVRCEGCGYMTHHREHMGCVRAAKQHTHPAPSVPADVVRDAERWRTFLATRPSSTHEVIIAAIDAAKEGGAA